MLFRSIVGSFPNSSSTTGNGLNDMINAINYGTVFSDDVAACGGIGGNAEKGNDGTISGVYWDGQLIPLKANGNMDVTGMTGVNTSVLTNGNML